MSATSGEARGADPDAFPQSATTESLASLVERAAGRVPALAEAGIWRSVTGVYDVSPGFPAAHRRAAGEARGLYVVAGFSGMGFKISPAVGLCVSELLLDGRADGRRHLDCFAPDRFVDGRGPIQAPSGSTGTRSPRRTRSKMASPLNSIR